MRYTAKKYLLLQLFLLMLVPLMGQLTPIELPADGNWPTIVGDSIMLIGPKQEALTEEQRYFNPPYLLVYPGKEHLKEQMIRAALCDCDTTLPNRRIGVFSVSEDKTVSFSQGNLQYLPAANLWKFADTQYEYLGNANKYLSPTFRNWVDLFGWSAHNTTAPFGVSTSTNNADYAGEFVDWGTNEICGDESNTWRTLSNEEWEYLLNKRPNAKHFILRAKINDTNGFIFLPDNWVCPDNIELNIAQQSTKVFTTNQWQLMENVGAVFLPAAGRWKNNQLLSPNDHGNYWSSTKINDNFVDYLSFDFDNNDIYVNHYNAIYLRRSVRLVHDTVLPPPAPCQTITVNGVTFNMMCVEGGTFMMGAKDDDTEAETDEKPQHQVTLSDYYIGQTEVTQALWEAVMGTNPSANTTNKLLPVTNISWGDCQTFVQKLSEMTGLHFRLPTEAEWEYAARGGQQSQGYTYAGSNNIDQVGWYNGNSSNKTHSVAQKQPNELGIYDMTGNIWEYCFDWHTPYSAQAQTNPTGAATGEKHVLRGGCYHYDSKNCTNTNRHSYYTPDKGGASTGLRIVLEVE